VPNSTIIVAALFAAFVLFVTARGELAEYIRLLV
jgi:hypothetical protein